MEARELTQLGLTKALVRELLGTKNYQQAEEQHADEVQRFCDLRERLKSLAEDKAWREFDAQLEMSLLAREEKQMWLKLKAGKIRDQLRDVISLDAQQARILASNAKTIRVTARAGSGKTRLLLALAYFLVKHYGYSLDQILLLAFNRSAADDLEKGLIKLLGVPAFPGARTFHSLAYGIVRPEEAIVYDKGQEIGNRHLTSLVQVILQDSLDDALRSDLYDIFRAETEMDKATGVLLTGDAHYDFRRNLAQFTLSGKVVKSQGEKIIGDFLFEHGLEHYYEDPIRWDGGWYRPDFKIKTGEKSFVILEHWAVTPESEILVGSREWPAAKLRAYQESAGRKRAFWKCKGVPLIETCARECRDRRSFEALLVKRLQPHFGNLKRLPKAELIDKVVKIHLSRIAEWLAQAIQRTQKQGWNEAAFNLELEDYKPQSEREALFLKLMRRVFAAYAPALKNQGKTDFDRVFNESIALLSKNPPRAVVAGKHASIDLRTVKICLVDEAQDLSPQFQQALECIRTFNASMRILFVGDDWQAINGFAGSSVEIFNHEIADRFEKCADATLATNYRSNRMIVAAGNALMHGLGTPAVVDSARQGAGRVERAYYDQVWVEHRENTGVPESFQTDAPFRLRGGAGTLVKTLYQLALPDLCADKSVGVLFRANRWLGWEIADLREEFISALRQLGWPMERVEKWGAEKVFFSTAHSFKGKECDTIFVVAPQVGTFPLINASVIELFGLFGDNLDRAERDERRLFYVALTRAKERLVFLCESKQDENSPYLEPLIDMISNVSVPKDLILPPPPPMRFLSTRGQTPALGFSDAVATGLAPDGGLFLPESLPDLSGKLADFARCRSYAELCFEFLRIFATDIPADTLRSLVDASYTRFTDPAIAPLKPLAKNLHVLELFHGPTLAFKDFALQLLGNLYAHQCRVRGQTINVLGATSGDTGAAAIHGLLGRPGTAIFILYPDGRVSPLQERQMACTGADNVFALAVDGTFDDAQAALKEIFADQEFRTRHRLSAVNSINLARVLAQCVYYLHAWLKLPEGERDNVEFVVPTGNFGNVLAGWMLQKMGVPIRGFRVATNQNDILYRLFTTGEYRVGDVHPSLAPSMDIQVASNFERFIWFAVGRDPAKVRAVMEQFKKTGAYTFENFNRDTFSASRTTDAEIAAIIARVYRDYGYIADPHTACGFKDLNPDRVNVVLSTASPAKFPDTIRAAIGMEPTHPSLEGLKAKPVVKHRIKATPEAIRAFIEARAV